MMKKLTTLALLSVSTLFSAEMQGSENTDPCCKPCCEPKPQKCIDCVCYSPPFYDLQCDWGITIDAEYLYWYSKESQLPLAYKAVNTQVLTHSATSLITDLLLPKKMTYMGSDWNSGIRIGAGFNSSCDGWDYYFTWTHMENNSSKSLSVPAFSNQLFNDNPLGTEIIMIPWVYLRPRNSNLVTDNPIFNEASGSWDLCYNTYELAIGKKYWVSPHVNIRPFLGLRGATADVNFDIKGTLVTDPDESQGQSFAKNKLSFDNDIWGVGLLGGIDVAFYFWKCFAVYGDFDAALLWGKTTAKRKETVSGDFGDDFEILFPSFSTKQKNAGMQPALDVGVGLRYEGTYCCNRYRLAVDLGWEHHQWFNAINRYNFFVFEQGGDAAPFFFSSRLNDLELGGLVVRVKLDF